ncbi:polysaccharide deacetylase [bacterium]|nr:polysaccharide deacetylase [bacterium]
MKKNSVFVHIVTNIVIIAILFGLYIACVPPYGAAVANAPIYRGDTESNKVAIMVNVYQGSNYVEEILLILEKYQVTCTFFVGGCWAEKNMDLLREMSKIAEIGNHGYLHLDHAKLSYNQNLEEIVLCDKLITQVTGVKSNLFAPPSGSIGDNMLKVCESLDYRVIMWSKDTIDWRDKDSSLVYKRATKDAQSGDMILMHPTEHTVKALPEVIQYYQKNNLTPVTVSEIIDNEF